VNRTIHGALKPSLDARIAAHVHAWEKIKTAPAHPHETHPFITISREFGCEAWPLAQRLAEILNEKLRPAKPWVAYDRELLDKVARELQLRREIVESLAGRRRNEMSELFDTLLNRRTRGARKKSPPNAAFRCAKPSKSSPKARWNGIGSSARFSSARMDNRFVTIW
jgi:hypothetical protein